MRSDVGNVIHPSLGRFIVLELALQLVGRNQCQRRCVISRCRADLSAACRVTRKATAALNDTHTVSKLMGNLAATIERQY